MNVELIVRAFKESHDLFVEFADFVDELGVVLAGNGLKFFLDLDVVPVGVFLYV